MIGRISDPRQADMFPPVSNWKPPESLPKWVGAQFIAIDTETKDNGLRADRGAGWAFLDGGHIVGISVATTAMSVYIPIRHPETENFNIGEVKRWLQQVINNSKSIVFHSIDYDVAWLTKDLGITWPNHVTYHDTHAMAVMVDENRNDYSLDACCEWQGLPKKDERLLREAATAFSLDPKADLWQMPAKYVGPYGEQDATSTLLLAKKLIVKLVEQDLMKAYRLEMDLSPLFIEMRRRGIRIDEDKCEIAKKELYAKRDVRLEHITNGFQFRRKVTIEDIHSVDWLENAFTQEGIDFPRTPKLRQGQFKAEWMETVDHWLPASIVEARKYHDAASKFIENYIQSFTVDGRLHAEIHRLRSNDGGTRSHRLSYSNPPLQQTPGRDEELGPLIRSLFLPDIDAQWGAFDIKQQEPRFTVHYASEFNCIGAAKAVQYYTDDPKADYHQLVAEITGIHRDKAKIINLSLAYGMGVEEMSRRLHCSLEQAKAYIGVYHAKLPFLQQLTNICTHEAETKGYITLIDGARCRFDQWEPARYGFFGVPANSKEEAEARWPRQKLKRAGTSKALNRRIQGSSARQVKLIMRECWKAGVVPMLQMHDELDINVTDEASISKMRDLMCNTLHLRVPTAVDIELGSSWGETKK